MKKQLYVLVALVMVASMILSACGAPAPTAAPDAPATQAPAPATAVPAAQPTAVPATAVPATAAPAAAAPVMLDFYIVGNGDSAERPQVEAAINAYIQPLINANVTFHIVPWGDWQGKAVTALQAGQKMDIIFTADWENYSQEVSEGLILPLNDDKGPNGNLLKQYGQGILTSLNPAYITGSQINGVNYAVPTNKEISVPLGFVYNATIAEEIGFTDANAAAVKTYADLEPWLAKAKAAHPKMFPYNIDPGNGGVGFMQYVHGFTTLSDFVVNMSALPVSGKVDETIMNPMETPWMADYLKTMRGWYTKGYINPDSGLTTFTASTDLNAGNFFISTQYLKGNNAKAGELMIASGNPNLKLKELYGMPKVINTSDAGGSMLAIAATSPNPVAAMKYINLMHSDPTLINMMVFGVPNTDWTVDADGRVNVNANNTWTKSIPGPWTMGDITLQKVTNKEDPKKNQLLIDFAKDAFMEPSLGFRFDPQPVSAEITAVNAVVQGSERALLTGYVDPATALPKYIADLKAAGLDKVIAEVQKQYTAWKAATKK